VAAKNSQGSLETANDQAIFLNRLPSVLAARGAIPTAGWKHGADRRLIETNAEIRSQTWPLQWLEEAWHLQPVTWPLLTWGRPIRSQLCGSKIIWKSG